MRKQRAADASEKHVASLVGGELAGDNAPVDIVIRDARGRVTSGVEIKTLIDNKNDKITVHPDSLRRKEEWQRQTGVKKVHTVIVDKRGPSPVFYHVAKVGSFRLGKLRPVSERSLKRLVRR